MSDALPLYAVTDVVLMMADPRFMCGSAYFVVVIIWRMFAWKVLCTSFRSMVAKSELILEEKSVDLWASGL